ncbi:MAG TPA: response regulator [Terriglobales bacterium]|nr:response regulator [Terriglobales bacterium]
MGKTVLCVDDERAGLEVRKMLLEHHGYSVLIAESGAEGLALFQAHPVDGVVLDYLMPGMTGDEVAAQMKTLKPRVPIVMLSAYYQLPEQALKHVDAFVVKGDTPLVLLGRLGQLVGVQPSAAS